MPATHTGETQAIATGVDNVGQALFAISGHQATLTKEGVFNQTVVDGGVTDYILFIRADSDTSTIVDATVPDVTITYTDNGTSYTVTYEDIANGNCKSFDSSLFGATEIPRPRAVVCNGDQFTVTEYTVVHEIGHLFDYRTVNALTSGIASSFSLGSCPSSHFGGLNYIIMGSDGGTNWGRGSNGWGSGPGFSNFQQNPTDNPNTEVVEAAADMFLNWVYRSLSSDAQSVVSGIDTVNGGSPTEGCGESTTENWNGFLNMYWDATPPSYDNGLPGDVRYTYMNDRMNTLMANNN